MTNDRCLKGSWPPEAKVTANPGIEKKLQNPLSYGKVVKLLKEYGFCLIGERIE